MSAADYPPGGIDEQVAENTASQGGFLDEDNALLGESLDPYAEEDNEPDYENVALPEDAIEKPQSPEAPPDLQWYVAHTYSGYENKVKANIEKIVENRSLQDVIHEVAVPVQEAVEFKNGKKKTVLRKIYPGYVFLNMVMNGETWYIVRNTRGVTSFVGPGSKHVPLTEKEVEALGISRKEIVTTLVEGDVVKVISGPFEASVGTIKEVNKNKGTVIVLLSVFGRETPLEMELSIVAKQESD